MITLKSVEQLVVGDRIKYWAHKLKSDQTAWYWVWTTPSTPDPKYHSERSVRECLCLTVGSEKNNGSDLGVPLILNRTERFLVQSD